MLFAADLDGRHSNLLSLPSHLRYYLDGTMEGEQTGNPLMLSRVELEKLGVSPKRDYSRIWNLPVGIGDLGYRQSTSTIKQPDILGASSLTEGRAFRLPRFVFGIRTTDISQIDSLLPFGIPREYLSGQRIIRPVNYSYVIEKGGGLRSANADTSEMSPEDPGVKVTYRRGEILGKNYGVIAAGSADDSEQKVDEVFSFLFHLWGGRTRLPIATYPAETFSTPDGVLTIEQAKQKGYFKDKDAEPVVSVWGVRCPWTIDDLVGIFGNPNEMSTKPLSAFFSGIIHSSVELFKTQPEPSPEHLPAALAMAAELVSCAKNDDDLRWRELAKKYPTIDSNNVSQFYGDYLPLLATTIGEQLGILYRRGVYLYMFNFQNISAVGEIKDFDVAAFGAKMLVDGNVLTPEEMIRSQMLTQEQIDASQQPNEPKLQAGIIFSTMEYITNLFAVLRHPGIINTGGGEFKQFYDRTIAEFSRGFIRYGFRNAYTPEQIRRNSIFLTELDRIYALSNWWDEPNCIGDALEGFNKFLYSHWLSRARRNRVNIAYKNIRGV